MWFFPLGCYIRQDPKRFAVQKIYLVFYVLKEQNDVMFYKSFQTTQITSALEVQVMQAIEW